MVEQKSQKKVYLLQDPLTTRFGITITGMDLHTLNWKTKEWLNDNIINFYLNLLAERSVERHDDGYPSVFAMSTFFMTELLKGGYSRVRLWTRKVDIFTYDIVLVPVHVGGEHWCMAIIDFRRQNISYYDSLLEPNEPVLRALATYLCDERDDKKGEPFSQDGWELDCLFDIPRQRNENDCGVFCCMFAEFVTRNQPITFRQKDMKYFRQKMACEIVGCKIIT